MQSKDRPAGPPQRLGVIGYPLGHTLSPPIQRAALDRLGLDITYDAIEVAPTDLPRFLADLRQPSWLGVNVTVPHKQAVIPYLDELSDEAREIGAVNTILHRSGRLAGFNTDARAFLEDLQAELGPVAGRHVLVLGAGGAAHAVCFALRGAAGS
ncbi:MAG: shikimate dehydrogenase family protein, partial [Chloroflexota bacterium]